MEETKMEERNEETNEENKKNELWNWTILGGFFWLSWMILRKANENEDMRSFFSQKMKTIRRKIDLTSFINNL